MGGVGVVGLRSMTEFETETETKTETETETNIEIETNFETDWQAGNAPGSPQMSR